MLPFGTRSVAISASPQRFVGFKVAPRSRLKDFDTGAILMSNSSEEEPTGALRIIPATGRPLPPPRARPVTGRSRHCCRLRPLIFAYSSACCKPQYCGTISDDGGLARISDLSEQMKSEMGSVRADESDEE